MEAYTIAALLFVVALVALAVAMAAAFRWFLFYWRVPQTEIEHKRHAWWSLED